MFARSEKGWALRCRNNAHVGLPEASNENLLSAGNNIQQSRIPTQGAKRDRLHGRQNVRQIRLWQGGSMYQRHTHNLGHRGGGVREAVVATA